MATRVSAAELDGQPLATFGPLFATLPVPDPAGVAGRYVGRFVGPAWLPPLSRAGLALSGFRGWWGKVIRVDGAINVLRRRERFILAHPMLLAVEASALDGRPVLSLRYTTAALALDDRRDALARRIHVVGVYPPACALDAALCLALSPPAL